MARFEIIYDREDEVFGGVDTLRALVYRIDDIPGEIDRIKADGGYNIEVIDTKVIEN